MALASEDPRDISLLASSEDFMETVVRMMVTHASNDPLASLTSRTGANFGKAETMMVYELYNSSTFY